jgi:hypothetical protein
MLGIPINQACSLFGDRRRVLTMADLCVFLLFVGMLLSPCVIAMNANADRAKKPRMRTFTKPPQTVSEYTETGWLAVKK